MAPWVRGAACCLGVALWLGISSCRRPADPPPDLAQLHDKLRRQVHVWVEQNNLARPDGFTYAIDVGQLLIYAARSGDRELYALLRRRAGAFLIDKPGDDFTRGFVAWRDKAGTPHDASGTTEALRMAQGLWEGAAAFDLPEDRSLARTILHGYARHAGVDQGVWLIRNYFNFETRGFATNSFLVDYDPDFAHLAGQADADADLLEIAERSYALIRQAATPSGLLYEIIQPEVLTLLPDLPRAVFSPNDVVQLSNSCTVAERCLGGAPEIGRAVLRFALARRQKLNTCYLGRSGAIADDRPTGAAKPADAQQPHPAGPETYAALLRLAVRLNEPRAAREFLARLLPQAEIFLHNPPEPRLYTAGEILLALEAAQRAGLSSN